MLIKSLKINSLDRTKHVQIEIYIAGNVKMDSGDENNNELHMNLLSLVSIKVVRIASQWLQTVF